ncbi:DUF929 family protein [Luteococcus peritonei]|uniref:DUF929 family protein n=1 Tax=Luteococcus peritonei TaxID=88874 RepID=A0ABW4RU56_9ACTN
MILVLALVLSFWLIGRAKRSKDAQETASSGVLSAALQDIPTSAFDTVGAGSASEAPTPIPGGKPVLQDGKPRVLYIGAEFCPYCAMDRLSLVAALSRFGRFSGLEDVLSSPDEGLISNLATVTFRTSSYSSETVSFTGVETSDRFQQPLATPGEADEAIFRQFSPSGGIPFVHYGSAYANSAPFDGTFLAGRSADQVADELKDPASQTSQAVLGGANLISAQICRETGGEPGSVCTSPGVVAAGKRLR